MLSATYEQLLFLLHLKVFHHFLTLQLLPLDLNIDVQMKQLADIG